MAIFSKNQLGHLKNERQQVQKRYEDLVLSYGLLPLTNKFAFEYTRQGVLRRMNVLARCVHNVFEAIPPDREGLPSKEELRDCEINLHAFYVNVFGCFDNLALAWVHERNIRRPNGNALPSMQIGFNEKCQVVRASLSPVFMRFLTSRTMTAWFGYLENFRHALAHRIPLYIPPAGVSASQAERYRQLEDASQEARRRWDFDEYDRLQEEQNALGIFQPIITHSYEEKSDGIFFHFQLLVDFKTVEDFANRMLKEFMRPLSAP
jgi:hypothetical protein